MIGAGTIGPDIAYYLKAALPGLELTLLDIRQPAIDAALARLREYTDKAVARGKMSRDGGAGHAGGPAPAAPTTTRCAGCDWVIEAATEDLALKRRIFADVEARVADDAIITSNTSSLPAQRIFSRDGASRAGDGDALLRAGLAQSGGRSRSTGRAPIRRSWPGCGASSARPASCRW